jgi:hypothetical protein
VKEWDSATPKKLPEKSAMKKSFLGGAVKTEKPKNPETKPDSKKKPSFFGGKKS